MVLREDKIGQSWLFPPRITDFIPGDHSCNLVVAVVERVDVRKAEQKYRSKPGNPASARFMEHPQEQIKLSYNAQITVGSRFWDHRRPGRYAGVYGPPQVEPQVKKTGVEVGQLPEGTT